MPNVIDSDANSKKLDLNSNKKKSEDTIICRIDGDEIISVYSGKYYNPYGETKGFVNTSSTVLELEPAKSAGGTTIPNRYKIVNSIEVLDPNDKKAVARNIGVLNGGYITIDKEKLKKVEQKTLTEAANAYKAQIGNTDGSTEGEPTTTDVQTTASELEEADPFVVDESMLYSYNINGIIPTDPESSAMQNYVDSISESVLSYDSIINIIGIPHQFLPITDMRLTNDIFGNYSELTSLSKIGITYAKKLLRFMPVLFITPGIPVFMSDFTSSQRKNTLETLLTNSNSTLEGGLIDKLSEKGGGKMYSIKYCYVEYFKYVNAMLRHTAVFLGIGDEEVGGSKLSSMNWLYKISTDEENDTLTEDQITTLKEQAAENGEEIDEDNILETAAKNVANLIETKIYSNKNANTLLGTYAGALALWADVGTSVSDSFSNGTSQSQLGSAMNALSDTGRELNFMIGNISAISGLTLNKLTGMDDLETGLPHIQEAVTQILGKDNPVDMILAKASGLLAGSRMVFPEIWTDSSFSRSYSCSMKLNSPYGNNLAIYLNIIVPICHLLCLTLPRENFNNMYYSPFILRGYYKGLFNIDMGIVTGLNLTKGAEGEWTLSGVSTYAEMSFDIKDLYEGFYMSKMVNEQIGITHNITELDYLGNLCGININDQDVARSIDMIKLNINPALKIQDFISHDIAGGISQSVNSMINSIYGKIGGGFG